jgi:hypothetical protein
LNPDFPQFCASEVFEVEVRAGEVRKQGARIRLQEQPVYVAGEAYLAAHQGSEAAAEFQKILDHRGIVLNEPIGALAHLGPGTRLRAPGRYRQEPRCVSAFSYALERRRS